MINLDQPVKHQLSKQELIVLVTGNFIFLFLSFLLQAYISNEHSFCDIDSSAYLRNGFLWYKYGSFSPVHATQQLPIYALGYPLFIGLLYKIFGPSVHLVIWVQILLALLAGLLLFFSVRRLFGATSAMVTYGLWSVNLGFLVFSHFILAEMFLIFLLILFFERFSSYWVFGCMLALGFAGLALGLSVLAKAVALYFPVFILGILWFKNKRLWRIWFKQVIVFTIPFCLPIFAFMVHNKVVFNQFRLTYIDSFNVQVFFYSQVKAYDHGTTWPIEINRLIAVNNGDLSKVKQQFWSDLSARPFTFGLLWLRNVLKIFAGLYCTSLKTLVNSTRDGIHSYFAIQGSFRQLIVAYIEDGAQYFLVKVAAWIEVFCSLVRYIFCCFGLLFLWRSKQRLLLSFFLAYVFYFSFVIACDGTARYRFFFEFVLIILAALGIQFCVDWYKKGRRER